MGYGLPAAIGACISNNRKTTVCIEGDGSLQQNIQELATVAYHKLPLKLFVLSNDGYHSIRQTQTNYFPDNIVLWFRKWTIFSRFKANCKIIQFRLHTY